MKFVLLSLVLAATMFAATAYATQHDIYFGGENGSPAFGYSPTPLTVQVGDTITWHGDFTMHPLASFVLPDGATAFQNSAGTSFSYVVAAAGDYRYRCLSHSTPDGQGMSGIFSAGSAAVPQLSNTTATLSQNFPNPVGEAASTMIHIMLEKRSHIRLELFDDRGSRVRTVLDEDRNAGMHMITINTTSLATGSYSYVLSTPEGTLRKGLVIAR
jgi:plastocyanin